MAQQTTADENSTELETTVRVEWSGDARSKMGSRGIAPAYEDGEDWAATAREVNREYSSILKMRTREDVEAILTALDRCHAVRDPLVTTWYTAAHKRAYQRVTSEILEQVREQGASVDTTGQDLATIEWPADE